MADRAILPHLLYAGQRFCRPPRAFVRRVHAPQILAPRRPSGHPNVARRGAPRPPHRPRRLFNCDELRSRRRGAPGSTDRLPIFLSRGKFAPARRTAPLMRPRVIAGGVLESGNQRYAFEGIFYALIPDGWGVKRVVSVSCFFNYVEGKGGFCSELKRFSFFGFIYLFTDLRW